MERSHIFKGIGYTGTRLVEIMGISRSMFYKVLSGSVRPGERWANGVRSVSRQIELDYERDLAALNERYAGRRAAVEQLIYDEREEEDENT